MNKFISLENVNSVYLIGIGGISMSAIAKFLLERGVKVSGSDQHKTDITDCLAKMGAIIYCPQKKQNVSSVDVAVYSSAIDSKNEEIIEIKSRKIPLLSRGEFLGIIVDSFNYSIAVSGSHGKTTASCMIANMFRLANKHPCVFLGGEDYAFGNYLSGKDLLILEACEYKKNFLYFNSDLKVVLNIDNDHQDSYSGIENQISTFKKFISGAKSIVNNDDENSRKIISEGYYTFGILKESHFMAVDIKSEKNGYSFIPVYKKRQFNRINLSVRGKHNVYNALATFSVGILNDIPFNVIKTALENYCGVKRRNECIGHYITKEGKSIKFICDYAHHPKEIESMLTEYKTQLNEFIVVFQPHTYSRTKNLIDDFVSALRVCHTLILYKTYSARERYDAKGSAKTLYKILKDKGCNCYYERSARSLNDKIEGLAIDKKAVLFLGAGDIYEIAKKM